MREISDRGTKNTTMTIKEIIQKAIDTGKDQIIPMTPLIEVEKAFKELGFDDYEGTGDETNGWQVDFWYTFTHPTLGKYTVSGSLWENTPWKVGTADEIEEEEEDE